jgi:hypothetical protein
LYAAHILEAFLPRGGYSPTDDITVFENVYFLAAENPADAWTTAEALGRESCVDDETMHINERPVKSTFLGVRKIISFSDAGPYLSIYPDALSAGVEATYSVLVVKASDLPALAAGDPVPVTYEE